MNNKEISAEVVATKILLVRGGKVMMDRDLSDLYGVEVKRLNEQVKRNMLRFPLDFCFQLTKEETISLEAQSNDLVLKSQFATSRWGGNRKLPYVFTEQGVAMLSSVLNSKRAIQVNIAIMRAFVRLRELLLTHKDLARRLEELEHKYQLHEKDIQVIFEVIRKTS
ncbi:MAG: ORF6N domain-containing protein [Candidatus Omnitrophica bacterium]|jgi:hypothetical protein|nr:ORF6N domain-containing protein [Candidatus Omnitrophota bacterium]